MKKLFVTALGAAFALSVTAANASTFDIIVNYLPDGVLKDGDDDANTPDQPTEAFSARQKQLFGAAENFWESVLTGFAGLTNATYTMDAWMVSEDGFDGSLAFAGPLTTAVQAGFTRATTGFMQFDADDFGAAVVNPQAEQLFLDSAVHEIGHALGFGTLFVENGLVDGTGNNYIGAGALTSFNNTHGVNELSILLQDGGGHWNECWVELLTDSNCDEANGAGFNDPELMTPYAVDIPATVSAETIWAFWDLGYTTIDPNSNVVIPLAANIPHPNVSAVPLPATGLLLLGAIGMVPVLRRKKRA